MKYSVIHLQKLFALELKSFFIMVTIIFKLAEHILNKFQEVPGARLIELNTHSSLLKFRQNYLHGMGGMLKKESVHIKGLFSNYTTLQELSCDFCMTQRNQIHEFP